MSDLGNTVIKFLGEKKKQRWVVESADLFELLNSMGILNDIESLDIVMEHLDESEIDINFRDTDTEYYKIFKEVERRHKFLKMIKFNRKDVIAMFKKLDNIKVILDDTWLDTYRNESEDEEEEKPNTTGLGFEVNPNLAALNERISNAIKNRIKSSLDNMTDEERLNNAIDMLTEDRNRLND